jgi:hypothetical protein
MYVYSTHQNAEKGFRPHTISLYFNLTQKPQNNGLKKKKKKKKSIKKRCKTGDFFFFFA